MAMVQGRCRNGHATNGDEVSWGLPAVELPEEMSTSQKCARCGADVFIPKGHYHLAEDIYRLVNETATQSA
jgi:hypothetical protein